MNKRFYPNDYMRWNIYEKISKFLKLSGQKEILDAGCGQGILSKYLEREREIKLYGIDFNQKSIEIAKGENYEEVILEDIHNISYPDKKFDKSICIEVFQYLQNPMKAFEELMRVTKEEIIIGVPNYNCIGIRSILFKKWRKPFFETLNKTYFPTNKEFLEKKKKKYNIKLEVKYISARFGFIRNLIGNILASEVVGIYKLQQENYNQI